MGCRCKSKPLTVIVPPTRRAPTIVTSPEARICRKCGGRLITRRLTSENGRVFYEVPPCNCGG